MLENSLIKSGLESDRNPSTCVSVYLQIPFTNITEEQELLEVFLVFAFLLFFSGLNSVFKKRALPFYAS